MSFLGMDERGLKPKQHWFTRVLNLEFKQEGTVDEWLDQQFTVNYEDGSFGFLFYKDKGVVWKPLDEKKPQKSKKSSKIRFSGNPITTQEFFQQVFAQATTTTTTDTPEEATPEEAIDMPHEPTDLELEQIMEEEGPTPGGIG